MNNNLKICIYGLGFVGNSMFLSFQNKNMEKNINLFGFDKFKNGGIGNIADGLHCDIIFVATESVLSNRGLLSDDVKDYLVELKKFVLLRKQKIISDEFSDYDGFFHFDFLEIAEMGFKIDPNKIRKKNSPIHLKFIQSDSQKSHIRNQFRVYENVPSGISRLIQRSNLKFFFRSFVVVN